MVEREFGVRYHPDHIGRLMHSLGWTPQKPERRALERNEEEIERWKQEEWPRMSGVNYYSPSTTTIIPDSCWNFLLSSPC
jgi:hypothetical protein